MKFLCLDCDEAMKLFRTEGPDEGSLTVTFRCPTCGFRVAMLTNPFETQLVQSLGVKVGGRAAPPTPFEHVRAALVHQRSDVFEPGPAAAPAAAADPSESASCPFAAMLSEGATPPAATVVWDAPAAARVDRIPEFIRPMARRAIERFAESRGYPRITEAVMDEARGVMGM